MPARTDAQTRVSSVGARHHQELCARNHLLMAHIIRLAHDARDCVIGVSRRHCTHLHYAHVSQDGDLR